MRRRYSIDRKSLGKFFWDGWLLKIQMRAFGWIYTDTYRETEHTIDSRWRHYQKTTRYLVFERISPYTNNILFVLLEFLTNIISWCRRIITAFLIPAVIIGVLFCVFNTEGFIGPVIIVFSIFALISSICAVLLLSAVGYAMIKLFKMEEKLEADMRANGYDYYNFL